MSRKLAVLVPIGALLLAMWAVRLPYYAEGPGPAKDVEPLIDVADRQRYESAGHFILTSVSFREVNVFGWIAAALDSNRSIVPQSVLVPAGQNAQQADQEEVSLMEQSKVDAAAVVLHRLAGYPRSHGSGVLIEGNAASSETGLPDPGCPAFGRLLPGQIIRSVNGRDVRSADDFPRILDAIPAQRPVSLRVEASGRTSRETFHRRPCAGSKRPLLGISTFEPFPFDVGISSGNITGPSAGLMFALGLYDLLTPGDLTGGGTIVGTGQIQSDGRVLPIGGVQDKIRGALGLGATAFLVPAGNIEEARKVAGDLALVPVRTFAQALRYLLAHGGSDRGK